MPGTFVYTPAAGTVLSAGAGQTLSVTFTPTDTANYTAATATRPITVTAGDASRSPGAAPARSTYGTALSATQLNATANMPGTFVYTPAAGTVLTLARPHAVGDVHADGYGELHQRDDDHESITVLKATPDDHLGGAGGSSPTARRSARRS